MPRKRRGKTSPLPNNVQQQIEGVRTGSSTNLSLWSLEVDKLTEVPSEVRDLTGLRHLSLGTNPISKLPSWLGELPNLEVIDISYAQVTTIPAFLPNTRWIITAEQALRLDSSLDPANIFAVSITPSTPAEPIERLFSLGRRGELELSELDLGTGYITENSKGDKSEWRSFDIIDSGLDEFLEANLRLRKIEITGCPLGRIPEAVRRPALPDRPERPALAQRGSVRVRGQRG